jgi:hypothetical protein
LTWSGGIFCGAWEISAIGLKLERVLILGYFEEKIPRENL